MLLSCLIPLARANWWVWLYGLYVFVCLAGCSVFTLLEHSWPRAYLLNSTVPVFVADRLLPSAFCPVSAAVLGCRSYRHCTKWRLRCSVSECPLWPRGANSCPCSPLCPLPMTYSFMAALSGPLRLFLCCRLTRGIISAERALFRAPSLLEVTLTQLTRLSLFPLFRLPLLAATLFSGRCQWHVVEILWMLLGDSYYAPMFSLDRRCPYCTQHRL